MKIYDWQALETIQTALNSLKVNKPNDRSEKDRRYQIAITDLEKVWSEFYVLVCREIDITNIKGEV